MMKHPKNFLRSGQSNNLCCKAKFGILWEKGCGSVVMRNSIHYNENFKGKFGFLRWVLCAIGNVVDGLSKALSFLDF